jgi:hypothetical protein
LQRKKGKQATEIAKPINDLTSLVTRLHQHVKRPFIVLQSQAKQHLQSIDDRSPIYAIRFLRRRETSPTIAQPNIKDVVGSGTAVRRAVTVKSLKSFTLEKPLSEIRKFPGIIL